MCGIIGLWFRNERHKPPAEYESSLRKALLLLHRRGPDYQGVSLSGHHVFGHARLSIIDLDARSNQPMNNSAGDTLVYNGEIYNYLHLKSKLNERGFTFHNESDTEVLLHFLSTGADLNDLNGFFAFGYCYNNGRNLMLARDRYGIKPLYYTVTDDYIAFSSRLDSLMVLTGIKQLDTAALSLYARFGYIPAPHTAVHGIKKLMPGTLLTACMDEEPVIRDYIKESLPAISGAEDTVVLKELLSDAVKMRLVADVPLGTFLSGGIDSAIVTMLAAKFSPGIRTFSASFPERAYLDEGTAAERTARFLGTNHTTVPITMSYLQSAISDYLDHMSEPFADSSGIAFYVLSEEVKKHVTVALSGDGADELFGGYNKYQAWLQLNERSLKTSVIKLAAGFTGIFPASREGRFSNAIRKIKKFKEASQFKESQLYYYLASIQPAAWFGNTIKNEDGDLKKLLAEMPANIQSVNDVLKADQKMVLPGDMLYKVDDASMAHALEVRVPFLDYRVVGFANALPSARKVVKGTGKIILREAFKNDLPPEVFQRRKQGFEVPLKQWLTQKGELNTRLLDEVFQTNDNRLTQIVNPQYLGSLKNRLFSVNSGNSAQEAWAMLVLLNWLQKNNLR